MLECKIFHLYKAIPPFLIMFKATQLSEMHDLIEQWKYYYLALIILYNWIKRSMHSLCMLLLLISEDECLKWLSMFGL